MADENSCKKRLRNDSSESEIESSEAKRLREDLLEFLNDSDPTPSTQELDSVMKSLQDEISASSTSNSISIRVTSDSGESQAQIGYLLEASDDELGLPPPGYPSVHEVREVHEEKKDETDLARVLSDSSGIGELWEFENQIPSYDSFDLGNRFESFGYDSFDGIFNHSDVYYDSNEFSDSWRHGTLPAQ
ncbi:uncharacterized protein LOC131609949 [Vicia villosa]|uniref:uncharacterized protein LOC131609904 n=1 Tax=Vicia villosa TaxID=3911 RepID=UPI00273A950B|nr:uncharacterized protein LOC131609904 [Vicia villosa]XP_058737774.1 uncharacterized protein LOC131609949 [Vicia villosa]